MSRLKETIGEIIKRVDKNNYFDSHFIIDTLILKYSDVYYEYIAENWRENHTTRLLHSEISKVIKSFENQLVEQIRNSKSVSYTIHRTKGKNTLWRKI